MGTPAVTWFENGTSDPAGQQDFYGNLFGWTFETDADSGLDYTIVSTNEEEGIKGGMWNSGGNVPNYLVPCVQVTDVAAACRRAGELGGKTLVEPATTADGMTFCHILDPDGNQLGLFCPPGS